MSAEKQSWARMALHRLTRPLWLYRYHRAYRLALESDRWSKQQIQEYHDRELVKVVRFAAANIPFYQRLYAEAGVKVEKFRGAADLPMLPLVTRSDIKDRGREMCVPGVPAWRMHAYDSGGTTTGITATMYAYRGLSGIEAGYIDALWQRIGAKATDRRAILRGEFLNRYDDRYYYNKAGNALVLSSYAMTPEVAQEYIELMRRYEVEWLHAYPSSAWLFATLILNHKLKFDIPLKGLLLASESIYPWQLDTFRDVLRCPVYGHYGHREFALLAGWCEKTTEYHFLPTYGYVEFRPVDRTTLQGEENIAEMVGTGYINRYMPMIRYATQDLAEPGEAGPCPGCGRCHTRAKRILGRQQNFLVARGGRVVPFTNLEVHSWWLVSRYQFVQDEPGKVIFKYVPADPKAVAVTTAQLAQEFGQMAKIGLDVEIVPISDADSIPRTWTGKDIFVVRSIPLPWEQPGTSR